MNTLRKVLAIVRADFVKILRNRVELLGLLGLPIALTVLLGFMFGGIGGADVKAKVALVVEDRSSYAAQAGGLLKDSDAFDVEEMTRAEAKKAVADGELAAGMVVPDGFGEAVEAEDGRIVLEMLEVPDESKAVAVRQVASGIAERIAANAASARLAESALAQPAGPQVAVPAAPHAASESFAELYGLADSGWDPAPITVDAVNVQRSDVRGERTVAGGFNQSSLGITVWFVLMLVLGRSESILEERDERTLARLMTTPTSRSALMAGKILGVFLVGAAQLSILVLFGALVFKVDWGRQPLPTAMLLGAYLLAATGMSVALSSVARTRAQASSASTIAAVAFAMLAGCFWPLEMVPPFMKAIAMSTPSGWAMGGLTDVVVRNQGLGPALVPAAALLGIAAVAFAVGLARFRWE